MCAACTSAAPDQCFSCTRHNNKACPLLFVEQGACSIQASDLRRLHAMSRWRLLIAVQAFMHCTLTIPVVPCHVGKLASRAVHLQFGNGKHASHSPSSPRPASYTSHHIGVAGQNHLLLGVID